MVLGLWCRGALELLGYWWVAETVLAPLRGLGRLHRGERHLGAIGGVHELLLRLLSFLAPASTSAPTGTAAALLGGLVADVRPFGPAASIVVVPVLLAFLI